MSIGPVRSEGNRRKKGEKCYVLELMFLFAAMFVSFQYGIIVRWSQSYPDAKPTRSRDWVIIHRAMFFGGAKGDDFSR